MVRSDELLIERITRIGLVYTFSGGFVLILALDIFVFATNKYEYIHYEDRSCLLAILFDVFFLFGNWFLLLQMKRRDTVLMHSAVIGRVTVALAITVGFLFGASTHSGQEEMAKWANTFRDRKALPSEALAWTWIVRCLLTVMLLIVSIGYVPILTVTYGSGEEANEGLWTMRVTTTIGLSLAILQGAYFCRHDPCPWGIVLQPIIAICVSCLVEWKFSRLTAKNLFAGALVFLPFTVVGTCFMACGPQLWSVLAGHQ
jgi:hypothetical protein